MKNFRLIRYLISLLALFCIQINVFSQTNEAKNDSIIARSLVNNHVIRDSRPISLNENHLQLSLSRKEILDIAKTILNFTYGKKEILRQEPFYVVKIEDYWVIWGEKKKKKEVTFGGIFTIIINSKNSCVEYLSHSK